MKAKALLMTAGLLCAPAFAGTYGNIPAEPRMASEYNDIITGSVHAAYDTRYAYKDMVVSSVLNDGGVFRLGGDLEMTLFEDWKQQMGAEMLVFGDGILDDRTGLTAEWKAVKELLPNLSFVGGYEFDYGNLPGYLGRVTGKAPHSLSQSFTAGVTYNDPGHGYFGAADVQYGFYGMQGWRFDLMAGKRWDRLFHDRIGLEVSAGTAYSWSYWGPGLDGFDQFNVKVAAPIRITGMDEYDGWRVVPYVQLNWGGDNRSEMRRYTGVCSQSDCYLRFGVEAVYHF